MLPQISDRLQGKARHWIYLRTDAVALGLLGAPLIYMRAAIDSAAVQAVMEVCLWQAPYWEARAAPAPISTNRPGRRR